MPQSTGRVDELVQELVTKLGFQVNSGPWKKAKDFASNTFKNHRFLTVDSHKLHRKIDGLCDKFDIHAQYAKARELRRLCTAFYDTMHLEALDECDKLPVYSVIDLLTYLANNPTSQLDYRVTEQRTEQTRIVEETVNWRELLLEGELIKSFSSSEESEQEDESDIDLDDSSKSNEPDLNDSTRQIANVLERIAKCVQSESSAEEARRREEEEKSTRSGEAFFRQSNTVSFQDSQIRAVLNDSLAFPSSSPFSERRFVLDCALALSGVRKVRISSLFSLGIGSLTSSPSAIPRVIHEAVGSSVSLSEVDAGVFERTGSHVSTLSVASVLRRFAVYAAVMNEVRSFFESVLRTSWNPDNRADDDSMPSTDASQPEKQHEQKLSTSTAAVITNSGTLLQQTAVFSPTVHGCVAAFNTVLQTYFDELLRDGQFNSASKGELTCGPHTFINLVYTIESQLAIREMLHTFAAVRCAIESIFQEELQQAKNQLQLPGLTEERAIRIRRLVKARAAVRFSNWMHRAACRGRIESFTTRVLVCAYVRTLRTPLDALDVALRGGKLPDDRGVYNYDFGNELFVLAGRESTADRSLLDLDFSYFWQHRFVTLADLVYELESESNVNAQTVSSADQYRPLFLPNRLVRRLIVAFKLVDFLRKFGLVSAAFSAEEDLEDEEEAEDEKTLYEALCDRIERMFESDSQFVYLLRVTNARAQSPAPQRNLTERIADLSDENSSGYQRVDQCLAIANEPLSFLRVALHPLIRERCERLVRRVNRVLCSQFRLATHFRCAQGVFLMRFGDAMHQFATSIFRSFDDSAVAAAVESEDRDRSVSTLQALRDVLSTVESRLLGSTKWALNATELSGALQAALADSPFCRAESARRGANASQRPLADCFFVQVQSETDTVGSTSSPGEQLLIDRLSQMTIHYCAPPILSILFNQETRSAYNRVFQFLLKVKWARCSVLGTYFDSTLLGCASLRVAADVDSNRQAHALLVRRFSSLRMRFQAFTNAIESFISSRVSHAVECARIASITDESCDIDELISAHSGYLQRLLGACLQTESTKVLLDGVMRLLELSVLFGFAFRAAPEHFLAEGVDIEEGIEPESQPGRLGVGELARRVTAFTDSFNETVTFLSVIVGQILARSEYSAEADRFYETLVLIDGRHRY